MTDDMPTDTPTRPRTFREVLVASDEDHDAACALALGALGLATGCSPRAAQRLLDGPVGAGLGMMVVNLCDEEEMALDAAITEAVRRQQGWGFGFEDGMRHGICQDAPFLSGWLAVLEGDWGARGRRWKRGGRGGRASGGVAAASELAGDDG